MLGVLYKQAASTRPANCLLTSSENCLAQIRSKGTTNSRLVSVWGHKTTGVSRVLWGSSSPAPKSGALGMPRRGGQPPSSTMAKKEGSSTSPSQAESLERRSCDAWNTRQSVRVKKQALARTFNIPRRQTIRSRKMKLLLYGILLLL